MKTYFVIRIGNHYTVSSTDFYNREFGEAVGDEILGMIQAANWKTAYNSAAKMYSFPATRSGFDF